jgi:pyrroline-5-carboxylate reductase
MQAGIELGLKPEGGKDNDCSQSVKGAAELILKERFSHPSVEIDKVTTPGGLTIKGINELEHNGFSSAIIKAMKASTTK